MSTRRGDCVCLLEVVGLGKGDAGVEIYASTVVTMAAERSIPAAAQESRDRRCMGYGKG